MATTVQNLIDQALKLLGAIVAGESPTTAEGDDAFLHLNQILANWNNQKLLCPAVKRGTFSLTADTMAYTMGPAGTFVTTARPMRVVAAGPSRSGSFQGAVELVPVEAFAARTANGMGASVALPSLVTADNASPLINVQVFPPPKTGSSIDLVYWEALAAFAAKTDNISLAPGFEHALKHELAVVLWPEYPSSQVVLEALRATLRDAKAEIASLNASILNGPMVVPQQQ